MNRKQEKEIDTCKRNIETARKEYMSALAKYQQASQAHMQKMIEYNAAISKLKTVEAKNLL